MSRVSPLKAAGTGLGALIAVGLILLLWPTSSSKHATAYFTRAVHIYSGSDVDVLGVKIGTIDKVTPDGDKVRVDFSYDAKYKLPANAFATFVEPTVVADRVLQLAPPYNGGPVLANHATIPLERTAVPAELDDFNRYVSQLATALGPQGANSTGALSELIQVGAANLRGEGTQLNQTLVNLGNAMGTLGDNSGSLFNTIRNLQSLTSTLQQHDNDTKQFLGDLATVSGSLAQERQDFSAAMTNLGSALDEMATFLHTNRTAVKNGVASLASVSNILAKDRLLLAHTLDIGAVGLTSYPHMYTPAARTYNSRFNGNAYYDNPALFLCQLYQSVGGDPSQCLNYLQPLKAMRLPGAGG